jgi:hypothetical protein
MMEFFLVVLIGGAFAGGYYMGVSISREAAFNFHGGWNNYIGAMLHRHATVGLVPEEFTKHLQVLANGIITGKRAPAEDEMWFL